MATSVYFNNFSAATINEQRLMEDVVVESIKIMGHDVWYIPRDSYDSVDEIFGEYAQSKFTRAYQIESYLANVEGYEGDGDFFSKFGLEIRDTSNFILSRRSFEKYIPSTIAKRPREGDLIFVPMLNKLFEIKFLEEDLMFFSLGKRTAYIYELRCELFRYSNENIDTGVGEIDIIEDTNAYTLRIEVDPNDVVEGEDYYIGETVYQGANLAYATATAKVTEWIASEGQISIINIKGTFLDAQQLIGSDSNTSYQVAFVNETHKYPLNDHYDNRHLDEGGFENDFIDLSENNPFGNP